MTASALLPSPASLGLPTYDAWYPRQDEAVAYALGEFAAGARVVALSIPTGGGKSLAAWSVALLSGYRTLFLTPTKALQDQYERTLARTMDQEVARSADIRGQNAYQCNHLPSVSVESGMCHSGFACTLRAAGCTYFDAFRQAKRAQLVVSNPAYYMAQERYGESLGDFDLLVVDEADMALQAIGNALTVKVERGTVERLLGADLPPNGSTLDHIIEWARHLVPRAERLRTQFVADLEREGASPQMSRRKKELDAFCRSITEIALLQGEWVAQWGNREGWMSLQPIWPSAYVERELFRGTQRILLLSGTLTPRDVELLTESTEGTVSYKEFPGFIPVQDRKIIAVRTSPMSYRRADYSVWINRLDQLLARRMDRKSLICTTSYDRRDRYVLGSRYRGSGLFITHGSGDLDEALEEFERRDPPAVLVSPSIVRGYDFPGDACRFVILGKVPWPDSRDPVVQARKARDPEWPNYEAMKAVQQAAGRSVRFPGDWAEVVITDDDWLWFWKRNKHLATAYFRESVEEGLRQVAPDPRALGGGAEKD